MRHRMSGRRLSRTTSHRRAMRRNMAASLFEHGAIRTTEAKAKEVRRFAEKLITIARRDTLAARRRVVALLQDRAMVSADGELEEKTVVQRLFDEIAPRYVDRPGGYTRITRLSDRRIGDAGVQVVLQLIEESPAEVGEAAKTSRRKRRARKRHEAAAETAKERPEEAEDEQAEAGEEQAEAQEHAQVSSEEQAQEPPADEREEGEEDEGKEDEQKPGEKA